MVKAPVVKEGYIFIFAAVMLAVLLGAAVSPFWAIVPGVLACYFIYFFRNPERTIPLDDSVLVSPADGTVQEVVPLDGDDFVKEPCNKVVIFLSVFNCM